MRRGLVAILCVGCTGGSMGDGTGIVDNRRVTTADVPPPPISGGTLLVDSTGQAVAADPDRDRISFIAPVEGGTVEHVELQPGDEPGRLVEDDAQRIHVVLRSAGDVVSLDLKTHQLLWRRHVCNAPRGIAHQPSTGSLIVACADGALATLPADGSEQTPASLRQLSTDLRDVVVLNDTVYVSRFRSAEVLRLDAAGNVAQTQKPVTATADTFTGASMRRMSPTVAWRMLALQTGGGDGKLVMVHQRSSLDEVGPRELSAETNDSTAALPQAYYGSAAASPVERCDGAVHTTYTEFSTSGQSLGVGRGADPFGNVPLATDIAVSQNGQVAIVNAGAMDPATSVRDNSVVATAGQRFIPDADGLVTSVALTSLQDSTSGRTTFAQCANYQSVGLEGQYTSAAYAGELLLLQGREPARLVALKDGVTQYEVPMGGRSVADTGHDMFHRDPGGGISCASCHPEGTEDGHVWDFAEFVPRRTQALNLNLRDTAPYHWAGDVRDMDGLVDEVMVTRMGSTYQSEARTQALKSWLFALKAPTPLTMRPEPTLVARGREVFESSEAACVSCHSGENLTDNTNRDVGTDEMVQVPSLVGLHLRAPYMKDGCAATLEARFDAQCGGRFHGNIATLDTQDREALLTYLKSL